MPHGPPSPLGGILHVKHLFSAVWRGLAPAKYSLQMGYLQNIDSRRVIGRIMIWWVPQGFLLCSVSSIAGWVELMRHVNVLDWRGVSMVWGLTGFWTAEREQTTARTKYWGSSPFDCAQGQNDDAKQGPSQTQTRCKPDATARRKVRRNRKPDQNTAQVRHETGKTRGKTDGSGGRSSCCGRF